jgi:hypothetical protein
LGDFVASFEEKKTAQTFIRAGVQNVDRTIVESSREEYKMDGLRVEKEVTLSHSRRTGTKTETEIEMRGTLAQRVVRRKK